MLFVGPAASTRVQIVGEAPRVDRHAGEQVAPRLLGVGRGHAVERRDGEPAVPDDLGRHALQQLERLGFRHQRERVGMRMRVDEARRDEPLPGVDRPPRGSDVVADRHHAMPVDRDVRAPSRRAQTVVDDAPADDRDRASPVTLPVRGRYLPIRGIGRQLGHRLDRIRYLRFGDDHHRVAVSRSTRVRGAWPGSASSPSDPSSG